MLELKVGDRVRSREEGMTGTVMRREHDFEQANVIDWDDGEQSEIIPDADPDLEERVELRPKRGVRPPNHGNSIRAERSAMRASNTCWWRTAALTACCCSRTAQGSSRGNAKAAGIPAQAAATTAGPRSATITIPAATWSGVRSAVSRRCAASTWRARRCLPGNRMDLRASSAGKDSLAMF